MDLFNLKILIQTFEFSEYLKYDNLACFFKHLTELNMIRFIQFLLQPIPHCNSNVSRFFVFRNNSFKFFIFIDIVL